MAVKMARETVVYMRLLVLPWHWTTRVMPAACSRVSMFCV